MNYPIEQESNAQSVARLNPCPRPDVADVTETYNDRLDAPSLRVLPAKRVAAAKRGRSNMRLLVCVDEALDAIERASSILEHWERRLDFLQLHLALRLAMALRASRRKVERISDGVPSADGQSACNRWRRSGKPAFRRDFACSACRYGPSTSWRTWKFAAHVNLK
jgi:hypothetical protein